MSKYLKKILPIVALLFGILLMVGLIQYELFTHFMLELIGKLKSGK